ncbi:MAG: hypothetical protein II022_01980, partial [Muribaculaceae bacterium]|nr:hypothetical protein [Muribaculaceae bacterium]
FNQFIRIDGDKIVAVDHGDAHPRSVVLGQYPSSASEGRVDEWSYQYVNLLGTPGNSGANFTGTSLGGFEVSQNNYHTVPPNQQRLGAHRAHQGAMAAR